MEIKIKETETASKENRGGGSGTGLKTLSERKEDRRDKRFTVLRRVLYCVGVYMALYGIAVLVADWRGVALESQSLSIITTTAGITFGTLIGIIAGSTLDN